jgi:hypothetical protein
MNRVTRQQRLATYCAIPLVPALWLAGPVGSAESAATSQPREVASVQTALRIPAQHPYLALAPEDIARAKQRAAQFPWAQQALKNLLKDADGIVAKPLGKLPEKGDGAHRGTPGRLFTAGLAYAFTGERRYAEWARDGLLAYADLYPTLPLTRGRCKLFTQSSLYEATWVVPVAQAYDLVADSGAFTDAQKRHVEEDLLRASLVCFKIDDFRNDPRIGDLHYRCYNFQAWHLSAIGLVGLAVKDPAIVDYAVNSPYGFRHLVAHDICEDGLFWERSVGYHHFVISALLPFTEAMAHCGVDLYHLSVPNDRTKDEGAHYVTDTSDKPKSLRLMFEGPFYLAFPNLSYIAMGDSDRGPLRANWQYLVGYHRYRDPKLAWLLRRDVPLAAGDVSRGRVGFLHYYRYEYRYENVRLNGQPVKWERRDPTFEPQGDAILVRDGGVSQSDHYLLNDTDVADFALEWRMARLADRGGQDRAWVVFHVHARNPDDRKTFALPSFLPELNHPYNFRLEVAGGQTKLLRDGQVVASSPTVYRYGPDWHWLIYDAPQVAESGQPGTGGNELWKDGTFANTGVFRNGCSLFPSSGVAVLRQADEDFTTQLDSTAVAFSYGPYGGGHGHPDKLSIAVYAQGRQWIPHFGSMPYESHWKAEWTAHTVSHNTVIVDGVSQKPTGERNVMWPVDSAEERVLGTLDRFDPEGKLTAGSTDRTYEGVTLKRTVQLRGHCIVDTFGAGPSQQSANPPTHQYDYVLHIDGALAGSTVALSPRKGPLGEKCGYQYVEQKHAATVHNVAAFTFAFGEKRLRAWVVPADGAPVEAILADGLTNAPGDKMPMLVLRRTGPSATFMTVIEPVDAAKPLSAVSIENGQVVLGGTAGVR